MSSKISDYFNPLTYEWFEKKYGKPTAVQKYAWPRIAEGEHVLVTAPTGSGKTLTAFLYAMDRLLSKSWETGKIRVLYISPLKALNNDIRKNLEEPLAELIKVFSHNTLEVPDIRVMTRSGDTSAADRRRMLNKPPAILITTPESLNIMLTSQHGRDLFTGIKTVILDEIHAVADSKRGVHLMSAVERVAALSGEFQRIALSATVNPLEKIACFVVGNKLQKEQGETVFHKREVTVVCPEMNKDYSFRISYLLPPKKDVPEVDAPETPSKDGVSENPMWLSAAKAITETVKTNRSTLVFANSRRGVERLARLINEIAEELLVFAHHGSLSREIRESVETRLKEGRLKGTVATNSLELGIDVGSIDEVLLLETPPSTAAFLQRLGRAGHGVGETSKGHLYVLHQQDLINAVICAKSLIERESEPVEPPECPLDVLAQIILSIAAGSPVSLDELYDEVRRCYSYTNLSRRLFDLTVEMLCGKYQGTRLSTLSPRLSFDGIDNKVQTLPGAVRALYSSGGTIPDRGYFTVREAGSLAKIGELDEEFVWERKLGDIIALGVQAWRIESVNHSEVIVSPHRSKVVQPPFWTCEERGSSEHFALRRSEFLQLAEPLLGSSIFILGLQQLLYMDKTAATELNNYLELQTKFSLGMLPHRKRLIVEHIRPFNSSMQAVTVLHTEWGGKINRPFAIALQEALLKKFARKVRVINDDISVAIASENYFTAEELTRTVCADEVTSLIREHLQETGLFGASFRENAARALLILKAGFGKRTPLWLNRKRAAELRASLAEYADFPITLETYRSCMKDSMDLEALNRRLSELEKGEIEVREIHTDSPSPFAETVLYKLINILMYEKEALSNINNNTDIDLIDEAIASGGTLSKIPKTTVELFKNKLTRLHPGYAPTSPIELIAWVKERLIIFEDEWKKLLTVIVSETGKDEAYWIEEISHRVVAVQQPSKAFIIVAIENLPIIGVVQKINFSSILSLKFDGSTCSEKTNAAVKKVLSKNEPVHISVKDLLYELLKFWGPVSVTDIRDRLCISEKELAPLITELVSDEKAVADFITENSTETEICRADTFKMLLRMVRTDNSNSIQTQPADRLQLFLAIKQKLCETAVDISIEEVMDILFGVSASPEQWEQEILPARIPNYRKDNLDTLLLESNLNWTAENENSVMFFLSQDKDLFCNKTKDKDALEKLRSIFKNNDVCVTATEAASVFFEDDVSQTKQMLYDLAMKGLVTSDSFIPLRMGKYLYSANVTSAFSVHSNRWKKEKKDNVCWSPLTTVDKHQDAVDEETLNKNRARILLDRFGIVFRELLEQETQLFKWSTLFKSLRLMELSGEVIGGRFFEGIPGIQFISRSALHLLKYDYKKEPVYWMAAKDPASLCGVKIKGQELPSRLKTTSLVFKGTKPVLICKRGGKIIEFKVPPDDPRMDEYLQIFKTMLCRDQNPLSSIVIEKINDRPAARSPYKNVFRNSFDTYLQMSTLVIQKSFNVLKEFGSSSEPVN